MNSIDKHYKKFIEVALAHEELTGDILRVFTGAIGEYHTAKYLNLDLANGNTAGYDAVDKNGNKHQIKSIRLKYGSITQYTLGGFGHISGSQDWEYADFCFMTEKYEVICIVQLSKIELVSASSHRAKINKYIGSTAVLSNGIIKYINKELYDKYIKKYKKIKKSTLNRIEFIRTLLVNDTRITHKQIISKLNKAGFDISKPKAISASISQIKTGLRNGIV